jgi:hypothetical protein
MNTAVADEHRKDAEQVNRPRAAKLLRVLAIPIIVAPALTAPGQQ